MFQEIVFNLLWHLVHVLYSLFQYIYTMVNIIPMKLKEFKHSSNGTCALREVHEKCGNLEKIPMHITVLLGCEEPSYIDLAKLVLWSITAGVSFISFYDVKGKLKEESIELHHAVEKELIEGYHVIWHGDSNKSYKNGFIGKKIHLKLLSSTDGRKTIAQASQDLTKNDTININDVDSLLRKTYEFPDPQLGIYCGEHFNIHGYPPWQIRLTEFFSLKSHHNITHHKFIEALFRYNKCEQRIGK